MALRTAVVEGRAWGEVVRFWLYLGLEAPAGLGSGGVAKETEKSKMIPRCLVCTAGLLRQEGWGEEQHCLLQH